MNRILAVCLAIAALVGCGGSDRSREDTPACSDSCDFKDDIQCEGTLFKQCARKSNGCLAWRTAQACPNDGICDASKNQCVTACTDQCEEDLARCTSSGQIQFCQRGSSGCFEWGAAEPCTSGQVCDTERGGCAACNHECAMGETRCAGTQVQQCVADENSCRSWAIPSNCPSGKSCYESSGTCESCQSNCSQVGATRCSGTQVQVCQRISTGCLQWSAPSPCAGSSSCDSSLNRCKSDPCNGVPVEGRCAGATTIEYCAVASGSGQPQLQFYDCPAGQACDDTRGAATCELVGSCLPGETKCLNVGQMQVCDDWGQWTTQSCTNSTCRDSALGAFCAPSISTRLVSGTLTYQARGPYNDLSDWDPEPFTAGLSSMLLLSLSGNDIIDIVTTSTGGAFSVRVPTSPTANDRVVAVAANADVSGNLIFFVADPGHTSTGVHELDDISQDARIWSWAWASNSLGTSPALDITEQDGSGAARIFDYLRYAYYSTASEFGGTPGLSLVAWIGYGTNWSCGACFAPWPVNAVGYNMQSQIWFPADSNESFWADPVTAHELGHWVMDSYGTSPNEGGTHYLGNPTYPGQAWSEGFATWFSSEVRDLSYYFDKQGGTMFWLDIDSRTYDSGTTWQRPKPANGLLQRIDENEVSAMLWRMSNSSTTAYSKMLTALAAPKMNRSPWARGYTRHTWDLSGSTFTNINDTRESRPMLADFLDTLMCSGFSKSVVDSATNPSTAYPYPSNAPLCQ